MSKCVKQAATQKVLIKTTFDICTALAARLKLSQGQALIVSSERQSGSSKKRQPHHNAEDRRTNNEPKGARTQQKTARIVNTHTHILPHTDGLFGGLMYPAKDNAAQPEVFAGI